VLGEGGTRLLARAMSRECADLACCVNNVDAAAGAEETIWHKTRSRTRLKKLVPSYFTKKHFKKIKTKHGQP
jgi:hypothetical protein